MAYGSYVDAIDRSYSCLAIMAVIRTLVVALFKLMLSTRVPPLVFSKKNFFGKKLNAIYMIHAMSILAELEKE